MSNIGEAVHRVVVGGADEFMQLGPDAAFTTELYVLIRDQRISYVAVPQEVSLDNIWFGNIDVEMPLLEGLKKVFFDHPILSLPYKATHLYIDQGGYTLVPSDLEHSGTPELWSTIHSSIEGQRVLSQLIDSEQMTLYYSVPEELYRFCQRSFSLPVYSHTLRSLIAAATRLSRQTDPQLVMMRVGKRVMDVLYVADGHLQLANRYQIRSEEDILYFVTALWRQHFLSPERVPLYLYDSHSPYLTETFITMLRGHINRVEINYYPNLKASIEMLAECDSELPPEFMIQLLCE